MRQILTECDSIWGGRDIRRGLPRIVEHRDVVYTPIANSPRNAFVATEPYAPSSWGIYDKLGTLVPATGFFRGPQRHLALQMAAIDPRVRAVAVDSPDETYVYAGAVHPHFGHFVLSTLCWLWHVVPFGRPNVKLLWHAGSEPETCFADSPHLAFFMRALGLSAEDIVVFHQPVRIPRLIVPEPSFQELLGGSSAFADLGRAIAKRALAGSERTKIERPAYISKARLASGVWRVNNEEDIARHLERHGVDIIFPEQLDFIDQIGLFSERAVVLGWLGSGMHTSIFAPDGARLIIVNRINQIVSNFLIVDDLREQEARYLYPTRGVDLLGPTAEFTLNVHLHDPILIAEDLLREMETPPGRKTFRPGASKSEESMDMEQLSLDAIGLKHQTDKSSIHHNFLGFYERNLAEIRQESVTVLEVGVYAGASARMWAEFFPNGKIVGVDIDPQALQHAGDRIIIEHADQSNIESLVTLGVRHGPFDLVVDDGSHQWPHQIVTLQYLYPFVKPGGYYILEDLDTSYGKYVPEYQGNATVSSADYMKKLLDYVVGDTALNLAAERDPFIRTYASKTEFISFFRRTCIIRKKNV